MFCPSCGSQNPDTAQFCTQCARPIDAHPMAQVGVSAGPTPPPPMSSAPPPPLPSMIGSAPAPALEPATAYPPLVPLVPVPEKTMSIFGKIGIVLVSMLAIAFAFGAPVPPMPDGSEAVGYRFGRFLGAILIPLLVAYLAAGRKKVHNPNLFAGLFCGVGLLLVLANTANSLGSLQTETTEQKLSRLVREAAGLQPVRTPLFGEAKTDTKMRNFFKEIFAINKEYQQAVDKIDMSSADKLASPESFADPGSVADGLRQLHAAYALDETQEQHMQQALETLRHSFDDLSPSDREDMLKGFNEGLAKGMPTRQRAIATEKAWIDAMDEVYAYAQANHADFHMSNGRLTVAHGDVMEQFNTRIRTLNARREEFIQAKNDFEKMQAQNMKKMGLTREQTGLH